MAFKKLATLFIIAFVLLILYMIVSYNMQLNKEVKSAYSGLVTNITYDKKGFVTIYLDDEEIFGNSYSYAFSKYIKVGDSVCKSKDSPQIIVYRLNNNIISEKNIFKINW